MLYSNECTPHRCEPSDPFNCSKEACWEAVQIPPSLSVISVDEYGAASTISRPRFCEHSVNTVWHETSGDGEVQQMAASQDDTADLFGSPQQKPSGNLQVSLTDSSDSDLGGTRTSEDGAGGTGRAAARNVTIDGSTPAISAESTATTTGKGSEVDRGALQVPSTPSMDMDTERATRTTCRVLKSSWRGAVAPPARIRANAWLPLLWGLQAQIRL
eukprot:SAG11_NODE_333_length_10574_cov_7.889451_10_plen_215_part_00